MPCRFPAVVSGLSGPLATYFYFKNRAQKGSSSNEGFLREPDQTINYKRLSFGAEAGAPLVECLPSVHEAWVHLQLCRGWVCHSCKLGAQKVEEVGSQVQSHLQLPKESPGQPDAGSYGGGDPKFYILYLNFL